ncbi:MAG: PAS domain-containing protein, partial [Promethearchaeota archaeon]
MESLENFRFMFNNTPFAIFLTDMRGIIVDINKSLEILFGYTKEELIGKNYLKFSNYSSEILSTFKERHKKLLKSELLDPIEVQVYKKDGIPIWVYTISMLIKLGEKTYIQTIIQDITERKLLEQKLKESEQKYKDIAELLPVVIYEADSEYNLTYVNKIAYEKFGYSAEEFKKGLNMVQFIDPSDLKRAHEDLSKFFKGETKKPQIYRLLTSDGRKLTARINSRPIYKEAKIVGIRSVLHDITEMVEAEKNLKESEEKFRTITEQSLMGIAIIQDDLIKYVNQQLRDLLGYNTETIKKWKTGAFASVIHPEDKGLVLEQARRKQKGLNGVITHYQYRLIKKTGEIIWVENYSKTIQYMGRPADLIAIVDITRQKNAEEIIRRENIKYKEFLDTASHE